MAYKAIRRERKGRGKVSDQMSSQLRATVSAHVNTTVVGRAADTS